MHHLHLQKTRGEEKRGQEKGQASKINSMHYNTLPTRGSQFGNKLKRLSPEIRRRQYVQNTGNLKGRNICPT